MKSRGFGDDLEKVFKKTGVKKLVEKVTEVLGIEDCGCSRRQESLNQLFPYKDTTPHDSPKIEQNIGDFTQGIYIFNNSLVLTINGTMNTYQAGDRLLIESDNPSYNDLKTLYSIGIISKWIQNH